VAAAPAGKHSDSLSEVENLRIARTATDLPRRDSLNAKSLFTNSHGVEESARPLSPVKGVLSHTPAESHAQEARCERRRARGKWSGSPLWKAKILLGVLREQGLAGKGLVQAFEKWVPKVAGCSRSGINRVYGEQTGRELSDYILAQRADKTVRYNQLPPEAEIVRATLLNPDARGYRLITEVRVTTDRLLLLPNQGSVKPNDCLAVIHVKLNHKNARAFDHWFG
jgi:hypothetical protein